MKGIWLPREMKYNSLINIVKDALQLQEHSKSVVLKYVAELDIAPIKIESNNDVFFYI